MSLIFEQLITTFIQNGVGQSLAFLPNDLAESLKKNLNQFEDNQQLFPAGIGQNQDFQRDILYRKDKILWLEPNTTNESERKFFDLMDAFVLFLNQTCYAGIQQYEFHYTLYEKGSFYKKHMDQFSQNDSRVYSIIMYLNEAWQEGDGGELVIYQDERSLKIPPKQGTMVFFDSGSLPHEVLETHVPRLSITGWLKR